MTDKIQSRDVAQTVGMREALEELRRDAKKLARELQQGLPKRNAAEQLEAMSAAADRALADKPPAALEDRAHDFEEAGFDTCRFCGERKSHKDHSRLSAETAQVRFGFASFRDRKFELIVINIKTGEEVTLEGQLRPDQTIEQIDKVLPTCVYVTGEPQSSGVWQPIETAPKDKVIMLCVEGYQPASGRWWPVDSCWTSFDWEGHFESDAEVTAYVNGTSYEPTHWMPLPAGPSVSRPEPS